MPEETSPNTKENSSSSVVGQRLTRKSKRNQKVQEEPPKEEEENIESQDLDLSHLEGLNDEMAPGPKAFPYIFNKFDVAPIHYQKPLDEAEIQRLQKEIMAESEQLGPALVRQRALERRRIFVFEEIKRLQEEYEEIGKTL